MKEPTFPTLIDIAQSLGRVEGKVDSIIEDFKPLKNRINSHEKDINRGKGALAALSALWVMTVTGLGIVLGIWRR